MSLRGDGPIDELSVPSGTTVEEHDVVVDGDVLVGGQSTVEFGIRGRNVAIGERVEIGDDIEADGDCRLDTWCSVDGNVLVGEDAYLGERVAVAGRLMVSGDLDIGDDVDIEEGFEANGWIVIRNPVPTLVFYFIVLSQLLRAGETDAADELAEALADGDDVRDPLFVPRAAEISDDAWRVSTPAAVGDDCRLHGNLRAESIAIGERNEVFGSLRARDDVTVGADTVIHGDVTTRGGTVTIEAGAHVRGDVSAGDLVIHDGAEIDGSLRARGEMKLVQSVRNDDDGTGAGNGPEAGNGPGEPTDEATDSDEDADLDVGEDVGTDPDADRDASEETDTDSNADTDPGGDGDVDTDSDVDTDTSGDTDTDSDVDTADARPRTTSGPLHATLEEAETTERDGSAGTTASGGTDDDEGTDRE
ncbi:acyltransferase [Halorubrum sp. 48-1-W]|uniref:polymer-forming cytoskeletal protein n=1 Tax=Halorubrum sp. 48-1-W TaxID=2249761 RepID=UPI000DCD2FED|nr:polymer-forming cytoskeletal protein [Halorubrum sp. 48-1-W]RAW46474.1 acyltransferase [Halorubrum sp. 48-1-W]